MFNRKLGLVWIPALIGVSSVGACGGQSEQDATGGSSSNGGETANGGSGGTSGSPAGGATSGGQSPGGAGQGGKPALCESLPMAYAAALEEAKQCDPALSVEQCSLVVSSGLLCGCATFVNPKNESALDALASLRVIYDTNECRPNVSCGLCLPPTRAFCSEAGRCEDKVGVSCKANGVVYPDRTGVSIKDPLSCNRCACDNGLLRECTSEFCARGCPDGTAQGEPCVECGTKGECLVRETGCYPVCMDTCAGGGSCKQGICVDSCD